MVSHLSKDVYRYGRFLVSAVIITLHLSNTSPTLGVTFLKSTAFDKIKGPLEI